jgi:3-deoxy-7-phosphoheptulonate synthase
MLLILHPDTSSDSDDYKQTLDYLNKLSGITLREHIVKGQQQQLTEIYLIGDTHTLSEEDIEALPAVERVIRISEDYRVLGRHSDQQQVTGFDYQGLRFDQGSFHVFAGLCAVDNPKNVETMMQALQANGQVCTRMGAYKPRTNPYSFQGHGADCLPWVFELAGKYGIKVIAMEVTHESHLDEINEALHQTGNPTGVIFQIGTRNTQNFELLKAIGRQSEHPALLKRGFGITLAESLNAAEYLDSVGSRECAPDGVLEVIHATAQGVIAGANMVLVDFHPQPEQALVDGPQALLMSELENYLKDIHIARQAYLARRDLWN